MKKIALKFLSTPSARRATGTLSTMRRQKDISIHALREEGDLPVGLHDEGVGQFLSTPSARRATRQPDRLDRGR